MSAPGELYRRIANGEPVGLPVPLDLRAVEAELMGYIPYDSVVWRKTVIPLLAALREIVGALELARPFVIQYGTASELQQVDAALDGVTDEA